MWRIEFIRLFAVAAVAVMFGGCSEQVPEPPKESAAIQGELIAPAPPVAEEKPAAPEKITAPAPVAEAGPAAPMAPAAPAPAEPAAVVPAEKVSEVAAADGEFLTVGFDTLAGFNYAMPDESNVTTNTPPGEPLAPNQIPADIQALNAKRVALKGFMLPLKVEGGLITELLVMRDQSMCCFGTVPKINEWVSVKMIGKGVKPVMDQAVTLYGALKVGEMYESGYLVGIYAMDGEKMAGPLDL